jgi:AcrR family transcriptional regulator
VTPAEAPGEPAVIPETAQHPETAGRPGAEGRPETAALPVTAGRAGTALRWAEHKEETRRKLLASARRLFAERGFQGTSAADIAADAGVTERTLFRYFSSKAALVLDEAFAMLPDMFAVVRARPAGEPPYEAVCQGILEFFKDHDILFVQVVGAPGAVELPVSERQRTLIDFEPALARVLHERYGLPDSDQVTAAVWARASIGAIRVALGVLTGTRTAEGLPHGAFAEAIRTCFALLPGTIVPRPGEPRPPVTLPPVTLPPVTPPGS